MQLRDYVIRRLILLPFLIIGVSIIVFSLTRIAGSPIGVYLSHEMSAAEVAQLEERFHLNDPLWTQYFYWVKGVFQGDFGWSGVASAAVADVFPAKLAATMELSLFSAFVAVVLGLWLGTFAGSRRNQWQDHVTRVVAVSGASLPLFWFGILLLIVFWANLGWFPVGRSDADIWASINHPTGFYIIDAILAGSLTALWDAIWHLILPALTLGFGAVAIITRMMRSALVEELQQDYVDAARAKGLPERLVLRRHARRNALVPTVTVIGLTLAFLMQGAIAAEIIFRWPGLGRWMASAVVRGDQATIMTYVLFTSVLFLLTNLIVDIIYAKLDPRVRLGD
ncbi:ABC transporter permease [Roseisalinus antarcticus]|uniref:Dipeptide transport system permease protein DppB n=1 Tax=Roseisalinus antarcticus TaxID=254357 RepID=A0A1Y5RMS3_9RHOB|nr:ABC transporter permease [Roseisalinus antarcticus]SLN21075.1 Dipeptide transport system permease protein DppB [Roseisalinus antarcticus]